MYLPCFTYLQDDHALSLSYIFIKSSNSKGFCSFPLCLCLPCESTVSIKGLVGRTPIFSFYCLFIYMDPKPIPSSCPKFSWERLSSFFFCRQDARHKIISFLQCRYPMIRPILIPPLQLMGLGSSELPGESI